MSSSSSRRPVRRCSSEQTTVECVIPAAVNSNNKIATIFPVNRWSEYWDCSLPLADDDWKSARGKNCVKKKLPQLAGHFVRKWRHCLSTRWQIKTGKTHGDNIFAGPHLSDRNSVKTKQTGLQDRLVKGEPLDKVSWQWCQFIVVTVCWQLNV